MKKLPLKLLTAATTLAVLASSNVSAFTFTGTLTNLTAAGGSMTLAGDLSITGEFSTDPGAGNTPSTGLLNMGDFTALNSFGPLTTYTGAVSTFNYAGGLGGSAPQPTFNAAGDVIAVGYWFGDYVATGTTAYGGPAYGAPDLTASSVNSDHASSLTSGTIACTGSAFCAGSAASNAGFETGFINFELSQDGTFTPGDGTLTLWDIIDVSGTVAANVYEYSFSNDVATVPVPAAAWLFGSSLLGLAGVARRRKARK